VPNNFVLLDRIELNANAASVTFDNIPQSGYTDLKVVISARSDRASVVDDIAISFNGSTTSFSGRELYGDGASAVSITTSRAASVATGANATASTFGNSEIYIPNYRGSTNKSFSVDGVQETNGTTAFAVFIAGLWSNTAAITSVGLAPLNGTVFLANSTFSLYGIAQVGTTPAIAPKADGGNIIDTDGTYWYHSFLTNGTFTPQVGLTCDYLVIAGGGGAYLGGGGAGGYRNSVTGELSGASSTAESPLNLSQSTNYTVTVGAGGTGSMGSPTSGTNSVFSSITSNGGGAGGTTTPPTGGGSGGGAHASTGTGANGTANQGTKGGNGATSGGGFNFSGGGGGAGVGGINATTTTGGNGGAGLSSSITGSAVSRGGGGGGYAANGFVAGTGTSGGGNGNDLTGTSGTVNTGGGGGGSASTNGNGGSGIVIIRYLVA